MREQTETELDEKRRIIAKSQCNGEAKRRGNKMYGKEGTERNENNTKKNTKQRSVEKCGEMGLKRWRVQKTDRQTMKKAFVFILEMQVHNERKTVKTGNELLSFILEVYKR